MRRKLRVLAALLVLGGAAVICLRLLPVYWSAWRFQRYLNELAADPETARRPDEWVQARVVSRAAELGLPVRSGQVRLRREAGRLALEAPYAASVNLSFYSVDLHFRPRAGSP